MPILTALKSLCSLVMDGLESGALLSCCFESRFATAIPRVVKAAEI